MLKKQFKYYAIRIADGIVFRRTTGKLQKVKSTLYKPGTNFRLMQVSYTGGKVVGCMSYSEWVAHAQRGIATGNYAKIDRELFKALDPYISKPKLT